MERAEAMLAGRAPGTLGHPAALWGGLAEVTDRTAFVAAFSNSAVLETDAGLVVVDTSSTEMSGRVHESIRAWSTAPAHTIVFTHGHVDHVFGVERYEADNEQAGVAAPVVVGHEAIAARFDRYVETAGYNEIINGRQFQIPGYTWPRAWRYTCPNKLDPSRTPSLRSFHGTPLHAPLLGAPVVGSTATTAPSR